jgi:hypothetical protein
MEENAKTILEFLCRAPVDCYGRSGKITGQEIARGTHLPAGAINWAVTLLEGRRYVRARSDACAMPFEFTYVELTSAGRETADCTVQRDAEVILAFLCSSVEMATGPEIATETRLTPARINYAVDYLDWRGCLVRSRSLLTAPYTFKSIQPTERGRLRHHKATRWEREEALSPL